MMNNPAPGRDGSQACLATVGAISDTRGNDRVFNATRFYPDPAAIVDDPGLSPTQQLRILDDWAQDLADRQLATAEGMLPAPPTMVSAEAQLLDAVNAGIEAVEAAREDAIGPLGRAWRRLTTN